MCKVFVKGKKGLVEVTGNAAASMKPRPRHAYKAPPVAEPRSPRGIQVAQAAKAAAGRASSSPTNIPVTRAIAVLKTEIEPAVPMFRTRRGQLLPITMVGGSSASRAAGRHWGG